MAFPTNLGFASWFHHTIDSYPITYFHTTLIKKYLSHQFPKP